MENSEQLATTLSAIIQSIGDGLVVVDLDGKIKLVNKSFENLLGWKREEVIGRYFFDVVKKIDANGKEMSESERLMRTDSDMEHEKGNILSKEDFYYLKKDGTKFPVSITSSAVILNDEQIGIVQIFKDITIEKEIEKAKSDYVSLASHQMRTPLTTLRWYAEMLLDEGENLTDHQKEYLAKILEGHERINGLIKAFLQISKIEMGELSFHPEEVEINPIIEKILESMKEQINSKKLTIDTQNVIQKISTDPKIFEMIIHDLLSNSVLYNKENGKVILKITENEKFYQIYIEDDGYGIPESQKEKIFEKLFRADNVRLIDTIGNGLSLYIIKSILDKLGGNIVFESKENEFTKFTVSIPK